MLSHGGLYVLKPKIDEHCRINVPLDNNKKDRNLYTPKRKKISFRRARLPLLGNLGTYVLERRTSTGSEDFFLLIYLDATKFV